MFVFSIVTTDIFKRMMVATIFVIFIIMIQLSIGDEILDIHGESVFNKTVAEVVDIIKQSPIEFLATVRPIASVQKALRNDFRRINYSSIMHKPIGNDRIYDSIEVNDTNTSNNGCYEYATVSKPIATRNGRVEVRERRREKEREKERKKERESRHYMI